MPPPLLKIGDPTLGEVDKGNKNKLKWTWLDETIQLPDSHGNVHDVCITSAVLKALLPCPPWCSLCQCLLNHAHSGKKALKKHILQEKPVQRWQSLSKSMCMYLY